MRVNIQGKIYSSCLEYQKSVIYAIMIVLSYCKVYSTVYTSFCYGPVALSTYEINKQEYNIIHNITHSIATLESKQFKIR